MRAYKAAKQNFANEGWQPVRDTTADRELVGEIEVIRPRVRDIIRNNALGASVLTTLIDYIAPTGLTPISGDARSLEIFGEWAQTCHISGMKGWEDLGRDIVTAQAESGDVLALFAEAANAKGIKTRLDLIEADRIRTPDDVKDGKNRLGQAVSHGVVTDGQGAEIAYYVAKIDPVTSVYKRGNSSEYHYIEAEKNGRINARLLRRPDRMRPGQTRGVPMFCSIVQQLKDIDDFFDAAIARSRAIAASGVGVATDMPAEVRAGLGEQTIKDYNDMFGSSVVLGNVVPGSIFTIPYGSKAFTFTPTGNMEFDVLIVRAIRMIGAALGMPFELIMRDYSQTSFSSGKLSFDGFYKLCDRWNRGNIQNFAAPVYRQIQFEAWLNDMRPEGNLTPAMLKAEWVGGEKQFNADPGKESIAEQRRMDNNLTTEADILAAQGRNWRTVLAQKAEILAYQVELETKYKLQPGSLKRVSSAEQSVALDTAEETPQKPAPAAPPVEPDGQGENQEPGTETGGVE